MTHILNDNNRRDLNFSTSKVKEVLPEYYVQDNLTLVTFLEKYYDYLDSSAAGSFKTDINNLFSVRDIGETELRFLDELIAEIGNGLQVASFFEQPRLMTRLLSQFYRSKGTLLSIEGFFRAFFDAEVDIEYPKDQIFIVGQSEIGPESLRYIINNQLYQTFSILIKSGVSVADYEQLYKRFVHPAGFFFAGQVLLETDFDLGLATAPGVEDLLESAEGFVLAGAATTEIAAGFSQLTGLYDSGGTNVRADVTQLVSAYQDFTSAELDGVYENIAQLVDPNSFTLDDSADSIGPDTSLTVETMDNSMFTRYLSDSSY